MNCIRTIIGLRLRDETNRLESDVETDTVDQWSLKWFGHVERKGYQGTIDRKNKGMK